MKASSLLPYRHVAHAALLLGLVLNAKPCRAEERPVVVVSLSGINSVLASVSTLARAANMEEYGQMIPLLATGLTQGLDATRPMGLVINTDGDQFTPLGFIPVNGLARFLEGLPPQVGRARKLEGDIIQLEGRATVFIRQRDDWAFFGQSPHDLHDLPAAPEQLLSGLHEDYDLAVRIILPNIPKVYRDMTLTALTQGLQSQLNRADEDDPQGKLQRRLFESQTKQWETLLNEMEELTIGWSSDRQIKSTFLDMTARAVQGTKSARRMALMTDLKTAFAGMWSSGAALKVNFASSLPQDDIQEATTVLDSILESAKREIDASNHFPDDTARQKARRLVNGLINVAKQTIATGKVDGAMSVLLDSGRPTGMLATHVADGDKLESLLKDLMDITKNDPSFPDIQFDVEQHLGVRFHTINVELPKDDEARKIFGDQLKITIGLETKSAYLAVGPDSIDRLKIAMDQSRVQPNVSVEPFRIEMSLGQVVRFASRISGEATLAEMAESLEELETGRDQIRITGIPVERGIRYRLELEEGVLRLLGNASTAAIRTKAGS